MLIFRTAGGQSTGAVQPQREIRPLFTARIYIHPPFFADREGEGRGNQGLFAVPTDGSFKLIPDNQDYATVSYRDGLNLGPTGKKNEIVVREKDWIYIIII